MMFRNVIFAARHRGLTSWAWTYNTEELFAQDYLFGGTYSMTTNFSTWATNLPVRVVAEDMTVSNGDAFACTVLAQNDEVLSGPQLSLVSISGVPVSSMRTATSLLPRPARPSSWFALTTPSTSTAGISLPSSADRLRYLLHSDHHHREVIEIFLIEISRMQMREIFLFLR